LLKELPLTIELVPKPCWYSNLRDKMARSAWDKLRKQVYAQYSYHCGICQASNVTLHCHEIWQYDDALHIQKLQGFIALCPMCHHCKHIGLAGILADQGKLDFKQVIEHFTRVNQCSIEEYQAQSSQAWEIWKARNNFKWTTNLGSYAHLISTTN